MHNYLRNILGIISPIFICAAIQMPLAAQNYTTYFTGNSTDLVTVPKGGLCMMGGASEHDNAMRWFLTNANGGDILVLRASGSDGYNDYLYSELGINVNSVETIVCHNANSANEAYIAQKISQAEAIWFAGGDQWDYVDYWRGTAIDSLINLGIQQRKIVIGGTSAGMAILGKYYFSAQNGSVTSGSALANPYGSAMKVDSTVFLVNPFLHDVITDTHFDNPIRKGRLTAFLARIFQDYGAVGKAIACDEYTAVCIDTLGLARVFGDYPAYNEKAYFVQPNCELPNMSPEICAAGTPLTWHKNGQALKVYQVFGTQNGTNTFQLTDWKTGSGGQWKHWYANQASFMESDATPLLCTSAYEEAAAADDIVIFPNPVTATFSLQNLSENVLDYQLFTSDGYLATHSITPTDTKYNTFNINRLSAGYYFLVLRTSTNIITKKLIVCR